VLPEVHLYNVLKKSGLTTQNIPYFVFIIKANRLIHNVIYSVFMQLITEKVSRSRYRPGVAHYSSMTPALERGWVFSSTPRPHFTSGKGPVPILQEAGWAPGPVWTGGIFRPHRDFFFFSSKQCLLLIETFILVQPVSVRNLTKHKFTQRDWKW